MKNLRKRPASRAGSFAASWAASWIPGQYGEIGASPPQLPTAGLIGRYEPDGVNESGGIMTSWDDTSGNANHLTTATSWPAVLTLNGRVTTRWTNDYVNLPSGISLNSQDLSIFVVGRVENNSLGWFVDGFGQWGISLGNSGANERFIVYDGNSNSSNAPYWGQNRCLFGVRTSNAPQQLFYVDGESAEDTASFPSASGSAGGLGGFNGAGSWNFDVDAVYIYNERISDADLTALREYTESALGVGNGGTGTFWGFEGDSITNGLTIANPATFKPSAQFAALATSERKFRAVASNGKTLATIVSGSAADFDPFLTEHSAFTNHNAILMAGINDIAGGATAASVQSNISTYVSDRTTAGWDAVYVCTILPSTTLTAGEETVRNDVNAWIRANVTNYIDTAGDPRLDDATDATYYSDGTHQTQAGAAVVAELMHAAV